MYPATQTKRPVAILWQCKVCGYTGPASSFAEGRGRGYPYFEHPEHRYCPQCHKSETWIGHLVPKAG